MTITTEPRSCGSCNACCKPFAVQEAGKSNFGLCPKWNNGCSIYASRPLACKLFECAWLRGLGGAEYRPDRLGVMILIVDVEVGARTVQTIHLWEDYPGATKKRRIRELIRLNKDAGMVIVEHALKSDGSYMHRVDRSGADFTKNESRAFFQHLNTLV